MAEPVDSTKLTVPEFCRVLEVALREHPEGKPRTFEHGEGYDEAVGIVTRLCQPNQAKPVRTDKGDYVLKDIETGETLTFGYFDTLEAAQKAANRVRYPSLGAQRALKAIAEGADYEAPLSELPLGSRVRISEGSGIDSGKVGVVVPPFDWHLEEGAYKPVPKGWVYLRLDNGRVRTMPRDRLIEDVGPNRLNEDLMVQPLVRAYVEERTHTGPEGTHTEVVRGVESEPVSTLEVVGEYSPGAAAAGLGTRMTREEYRRRKREIEVSNYSVGAKRQMLEDLERRYMYQNPRALP